MLANAFEGSNPSLSTILNVDHNQEIILLHVFIKKEQKTPIADLRSAKKRKTLYLQSHE
ncbi:MAG: type II toxin-antitoxin system RelE/ParE family toxin [Verrucomicrobiae bacterium]|nr:type II toxin-antitoxin system RelE/ParE family toxin [Verrucomicrobiae bacterium]